MINRYLRLNNYGKDISRDIEFKKSRECLVAKKKHLKQLGLGNRPNASEAVNSEDEDELYDSGAFGQNNPDSLITTIWYMNTVHFGLRGSHEHRQLKWGDVKLESDQNGVQSLTYNERITKTRDGSNTKNTIAYGPKSWPNPNDERRCHIATYLKFRSQRPADACDAESPFYLGVNRMKNAKHWYKNQPFGEKVLKNLMKSAVQKSNVDKNKKLTNHSDRKTAVTRLHEEGLPLTSIQQHTGHKNISSINNYAVNRVKTQKKMSAILSKSSKPHTYTSEELSTHSKTESSESDSVQKAASATVEQIPCNNHQPETTQKSSGSTSILNSASGPLRQ